MSHENPSPKKNLSWLDYKRIVSKKYTDIILSDYSLKKLLLKERKSLRLPNYQIKFLEENYPTGNFSDAIRDVIDDFITIQSEKMLQLEKNIDLEEIKS